MRKTLYFIVAMIIVSLFGLLACEPETLPDSSSIPVEEEPAVELESKATSEQETSSEVTEASAGTEDDLNSIALYPGTENCRKPIDAAVNTKTNRIYVAFEDSKNIAVVDGNTNQIVTVINLGIDGPYTWFSDLEVDTASNRVYASTHGSRTKTYVIDGEDNAVVTEFGNGSYGLTLNPATGLLYKSTGGKRISVIDTQDGNELDEIQLPEGVEDVAVNVATNRIYVSHFWDDIVSVVDGTSSQIINTIEVDNPEEIVIDSARNRIYVFSPGMITLLDGETDTLISEKSLAFTSMESPVIDPRTGNLYMRLSPRNKLVEIDGSNLQIISEVPIPYTLVTQGGWGDCLAINEATNRLYFISPIKDSLQIMDIADATFGRIETIILGSGPVDLAVNWESNKVYVANAAADTIDIMDAVTNQIIKSVEVGDIPAGHCISVDINRNKISVATKDGLYIIDGTTGTVESVVDLSGDPMYIAADTDLGRVYVTDQQTGDGHIYVIDIEKGIRLERIEEIFPDGLAVDSKTNKIYCLRLTGGKVSPVISEIEPVPSGLRMTVTGWTQEGGPLTGGITVYDGTSFEMLTGFVLPVYHYTIPVAVDESTNKVFIPLNAGRISAAGIDHKMGLMVIDSSTDTVVELMAPSDDISDYFEAITNISVDPENSRLFLLSEMDVIIVIDTKELGVESVIELSHGKIPKAVAANPESGNIYLANSGDGTLSIIDLNIASLLS
jgi:YVTN family beta-propeller protein